MRSKALRRCGVLVGCAGLLSLGVPGAASAASLGVPAAASAASVVPGAASAATPATVTLPAPTGPDQIGTVAVHLVDHSRPDPWQPGTPRELMVSVWYPARNTAGYPLAQQMRPGAAAGFAGFNTLGIPDGTVDWAATTTHAHLGAPVNGGRHPVVLYSPGAGDPRTLDTTLVEQLASHGYVVVTIDHTYETFVEFPGGRVTTPEALAQAPQSADGPWADYLRKIVSVREADTRFVLDELPRLPLAGSLDLARIGMFGHSAGGFTALATMHDDRRIRAAIDMDGELNYAQEDVAGTPMSTVVNDGLDRPFLLLGSKSDGRHNRENASWNLLWNHSHGCHRDLYLTGSQHATFTDAEAFVPQLVRQGVLTRSEAGDDIGSTDPVAALAADRAYVTAFFDRFLRHRDDRLLNGPSPKYPDMTFVN